MSPDIIGLIGLVLMLILFAIGMPISFAMAFAGVAGYAYLVSPEVGFSLLPRDVFEQFASYPLSVIPMFVLMGCYAFAAGIGKKLFETAHVLFGHMPGGLAVATVAASTVFGAVCGSTSATCATIGRIAIPEMKRFGYSDWLSTGTVTVAGGLGVMIPPSTIFIVYGILTEQSIGKLCCGNNSDNPGSFYATIYIICKRDPTAVLLALDLLKQKFVSLKGLSSPLFICCSSGAICRWFTLLRPVP